MTSIIDKEILNDGDVTVEDEELIFCPYNSNNKEATEREVSDILVIDLIACNNYKNGSKAAKTINCPTLFIFGEIDKMITLTKGKEFSDLVSNSKTHVIKDCGHMIMFENAFEMREKIVEFLKK